MFYYQAIPFTDLISPWSKEKILIALELVNADLCNQLDCSLILTKGLQLAPELTWDFFTEFFHAGYAFLESEITERQKQAATQLIDYCRQPELQPALRAFLFINEQFIDCSAHQTLANSGANRPGPAGTRFLAPA